MHCEHLRNAFDPDTLRKGAENQVVGRRRACCWIRATEFRQRPSAHDNWPADIVLGDDLRSIEARLAKLSLWVAGTRSAYDLIAIENVDFGAFRRPGGKEFGKERMKARIDTCKQIPLMGIGLRIPHGVAYSTIPLQPQGENS